jgi:hypothetical protein
MNFVSISKAKKETGLAYLGNVDISSKLEKNSKYSGKYTYCMYLAPSNISGFNTCPMATKECIDGCLNTSGRVIMDIKNQIIGSRIKKTKLFFEHRNYFMNWLLCEILAHKIKAEKLNKEFSVRLNGTSDINWAIVKFEGKNVFETFPDVQFYDYTKISKKFENKPTNYHLTFSYTGYNWSTCEMLLNKGFNIAVIFNVKKNSDLPETFKGFKVIDGDLTDYRPNDEKGCIIGLRWKKIANKETNERIKNSVFVEQV